MAKRKSKTQKKVEKEVKKQAKKHPVVFILIIVAVLAIAAVTGFILYKNGYLDSILPPHTDSSQNDSSKESDDNRPTSSENPSSETSQTPSSEDDSSSNSHEVGDFDDLSFYFISAGKSGTLYNGDCIYIKAGETDILIDSGRQPGNYTNIAEEINKHCTDNKLEYVVATHSDADHLGGFFGTSKKGILYSYDVGTIIDFAKTNKTTYTESSVYGRYIAARDYAVSKGATHYTALECYNNENGAKRSYDLGKGITMNVLYQKFYENNSQDENNYSVSLLFKQGEKKMLLCGDLEDDGITSLLASNEIGQVDLYKAGHHGSINANPEALLKEIEPKTICVCCVAGSNEYTANNQNTMPYQASIDNWAKYTKEVYVTNYAQSTGTVKDIGPGGELNGTITVHYSTSGEKTVTGSNNSLTLRETTWMKENRTMPEEWK